MTYREKLEKAAPTMAAVYERTFGRSLKARALELLVQYPDVREPNWLSWEGHRITNIATSDRLRTLVDVL